MPPIIGLKNDNIQRKQKTVLICQWFLIVIQLFCVSNELNFHKLVVFWMIFGFYDKIFFKDPFFAPKNRGRHRWAILLSLFEFILQCQLVFILSLTFFQYFPCCFITFVCLCLCWVIAFQNSILIKTVMWFLKLNIMWKKSSVNLSPGLFESLNFNPDVRFNSDFFSEFVFWITFKYLIRIEGNLISCGLHIAVDWTGRWVTSN